MNKQLYEKVRCKIKKADKYMDGVQLVKLQ